MLEVQNLSMRFGGLLAVDEVSLDVQEHEIVSIIGPNGAGKTTVFNCMSGFYKPTGGKILFEGKEVQGKPDYKISRLGMVRTFQHVRLFSQMTVVENLLVAQHRHLNTNLISGLIKTPSYRAKEQKSLDRAAYWLDRVGLLDLANREAGNLAYGQQRRLEIARCMVTEPKLLMLDEPAAGLNPAEHMLVLEDVHTHYGKIEALHGVSVEVKKGEIVSLIGANGAGKTTLLMTVCGNPQASSGRIFLEGREITREPTAQIMRSGIAIVPEGRRIFSGLTVEENLHMGGFFNTKAEIRKSIDHVYELFPRLQEREHQRAGTMSGGEQQMLAIGRALMSKPRMIILDEPSLGLAPLVIKQIFEIIGQLREEGITVFLVEQNAHQALNLADRGYVLETGKIRLHDTGKNLLENPDVQNAYLGG